jgi:hypothetical protein
LDLAGLGEGGALAAALAVLDRNIVAVVGADARAWVLPASYTAQRSTRGPCLDSRPGGPLRSEDQTVTTRPGEPDRLAGRVEEHRVYALHPGGVLGPEVVVGLQQCPAFQDEGWRNPALRQPPLGQQLPQVPRVGLVLACRLRLREKAASAGSATCAATSAPASSSPTYHQPVHPSSANATSFRPANRPHTGMVTSTASGATGGRAASP